MGLVEGESKLFHDLQGTDQQSKKVRFLFFLFLFPRTFVQHDVVTYTGETSSKSSIKGKAVIVDFFTGLR